MRKIKTIDLFAGCGGLLEGFEQHGGFETLACVEWEKLPCENLRYRLQTKWNYSDADDRVVRFDIQRTSELINGFDDAEYGKHKGLSKLVGDRKVDVIVGGPPCQAYSLAGRIRDANGMRDDYRNYLFESYIGIVRYFAPSFFVFQNVPGMLSAMPDGTPIIDKIRKGFFDIGYEIVEDIKQSIFDLADYGIPQNRTRIVILGVRRSDFPIAYMKILNDFYLDIMPSYYEEKKTVEEAIGDLPILLPLKSDKVIGGKKYSHNPSNMGEIMNHTPRYHNRRDIKLFQMLAKDIESGENEYISAEKLKELYTDITGKKSNVHKYYVLRRDAQSNTIPAHLYKDGLRHIHPDPKQARSITVREAARLQTFPDDYHFSGGMMHQYKMIGNAVPPHFSNKLAMGIKELFFRYKEAGDAVLRKP